MSNVYFKILNLIIFCRLVLILQGSCYGYGHYVIELDSVKTGVSLLDITENNFKNGKVNYVTRDGGFGGSLGHTHSSPVEEGTLVEGSGSSRVTVVNGLKDIHIHSGGNSNFLPKKGSHEKVLYAPIEHLRDSQFVGEILVGTPGQKFKPIFDTGSANTWVISKECDLPTCKKVPRFDPSKSKTYKHDGSGPKLTVYFGTGMIKGSIVSETVGFCGSVLDDQNIALVEFEGPSEHGDGSNIFERLDFQGLFGLAFPEMSATGDTVFQSFVKKNNLSPEFAFYISTDDTPSLLLVGGVDDKYYQGEIKYVPVVRNHYWEVSLTEFWVGDEKLCCDYNANDGGEDSYVILDSGTSYNSLPHGDYEKFIKLVPTIPEGSFNPEMLSSYPVIKYVIGGMELILEPADYMILHNGHYKPGFVQINVPSQFGNAYILGSNVFMKSYFTVFKHAHNGNPAMIGFAKSKKK